MHRLFRWIKIADRCNYSYTCTPITAVGGHAATLRFGQSCRTYSDFTISGPPDSFWSWLDSTQVAGGEEVVLKWVEDDITYRWSGGLAENCPQNGDGHCMNNYGRHSADPSWVAACLICSPYSGGSHAGAHSCPEIEKGFCGAIASGSSVCCPAGRKSLTRPCCGRMHACVICEGEVVHSCPPGFRWMGVAWRLKTIGEPEGIEWYIATCVRCC